MKTKLEKKDKKVQEAMLPEQEQLKCSEDPTPNSSAKITGILANGTPCPEPAIVRAAQLVVWAQRNVNRTKEELKVLQVRKLHLDNSLQHDELELAQCEQNLYRLNPCKSYITYSSVYKECNK